MGQTQTPAIETVTALIAAMRPPQGARTADGHQIVYAILHSSGQGGAYVQNVVRKLPGDVAPNSDIAYHIPVSKSVFDQALADGLIERYTDSYAAFSEYRPADCRCVV